MDDRRQPLCERRTRRTGPFARLAATVAALLAGLAPAFAEPALWVARDADSTVYMFGTFHVLKPEASWESEATLNAFLESDELWLEVNLTGSSGSSVNLMALGTRPGQPLSASIPAKDLETVKTVAKSLAIPYPTLEPLRPWLASVIIARHDLKAAGYTSSGPDLAFAGLATRTAKPVRAFETPASQFGMFARLSPEAELAVLRASLDEAGERSDYFDAVAAAWLAGDVETLETRALDEIRAMGPEVYDTLVTDRNRAMAETIRSFMQEGSGRHFVAVGAAHLIGPDSIQRFLADAGIESERVNTPAGPLAP